MSLKCPKTVSGSTRPTGKNLALRTAPAFLQNFRASRSARHSAFKELYLAKKFRAAQRVLGALLGRFVGTSGRQSVFQELFFWHFRAAQRVLESCFLAKNLGRHSAFWKRFFDSLPSKGSSEPYKNPKFQGAKTEVISVLKMLVLQGPAPNPDRGPFYPLLIKISF